MGIERGSIQKRVEALPEELRKNLEELSREGRVEEFFIALNSFGISATEQTEYASHFMKELREGLKVISWNKERLMYMAVIVENTIIRQNSNPASSENLIKNYLVFSRIFQNQEGVMPRFGQFSYIMRAAFNGVETREEISQRINDHKTFGENDIDPEEMDAFYKNTSDQVGQTEAEIDQAMADAKVASEKLRETIPEATEEEKKEKSTVWSGKYSKPKEYTFPNYTFQTGNRQGLNTAVGRSSWEPMFLAFMDTANKKMEDGVNSRTDLTEEQKREAIKNRRIELLYEQFEFPVGIKKTEDGKDKAIMYLLDFIDINRWQAIEIKGPLTPSAAEKIKAFKKYYVEQDFSDLPEDQKIIMMGLVYEKLEEIKRWCRKNNYPVFDHFTNYQVFGAQRWDFEFNNFNSHKQPVDTRIIPEDTQESLRKGLIKFIEEKFPNLKPENYVNVDDLPKLIKINKDQAKKSGEKYVVERPLNTEPFMPEQWAKNYFKKYGFDIEFDQFDKDIYEYIFSTIPISNADEDRMIILFRTIKNIEKISNLFKRAIIAQKEGEIKKIESGVKFYLPIPSSVDLDEPITVLRELIHNIENVYGVRSEDKNKFVVLIRDIQDIIEIIRVGYDKKQERFIADYEMTKRLMNFPAGEVERVYSELFLPNVMLKVIFKRFNQLRLFFVEKRYENIDVNIIDGQINSIINMPTFLPGMFENTFFLFATKIANKEKLPRSIREVINLRMFFMESTSASIESYRSIPPDLLKCLYDSLIEKFKTRETVARSLSSLQDSPVSYEEVFNFIKVISLIPMSTEELLNNKIDLPISKISNLVDLSLRCFLEDKYESCMRAIDETIQSEQFQALKRKVKEAA